MRIWKGKEMEGRESGRDTLFIESRALGTRQLVKTQEFIESEGIRRLYFGAGKVDVLGVSDGFFEYFINEGCEVIVETSYKCPLLDYFFAVEPLSVIVRTDTQKRERIAFKTDNGREAIIYYPDTVTPLNAVVDGKYEQIDTMLWED